MRNARRCGIHHNVLDFDNDGRDGFPLSSLTGIEIRVGGVVVERIIIDHLNIEFRDDEYDEENQMESIMLHHNINRRRHLSGLITCMDGKIGPLPLGWRQRHAGGNTRWDLTEFLEEVADENNDLTPQTLMIKGLVLLKNDMSGIMSFIKK